jgi:hypothetical protein
MFSRDIFEIVRRGSRLIQVECSFNCWFPESKERE